MTQFWREGFWRVSVNGVEHWVEGHWVDRDDWWRSGATHGAERDAMLREMREARALNSASARFVVPNAECPVCGQDVFFFQNEHGSRVYFDELGPPWPKHPCTDQTSWSMALDSASGQSTELTIRETSDVASLSALDARLLLEPERLFGERYAAGRWSIYRVEYRARSASGAALILTNCESTRSRRAFFAGYRVPRAIQRGSLVFVAGSQVAYLDPQTLLTWHIELQRLDGMKGFIDDLIADDLIADD